MPAYVGASCAVMADQPYCQNRATRGAFAALHLEPGPEVRVYDRATEAWTVEGEGAAACPAAADAVYPDDGGDGNEYFDAHDDFAPPEIHGIPAHLDDENWLQSTFKHAQEGDALRVLELAASPGGDDSPEVFICAPAYNFESRVHGAAAVSGVEYRQAARRCPLAFLRIRPIYFQDGMHICNTCNNPGCDRSLEQVELFARVCNLPSYESRLYGTVSGGASSLCRCARTACKALWGSSAVEEDDAEDAETFTGWLLLTEPFGAHRPVIQPCTPAFTAYLPCHVMLFRAPGRVGAVGTGASPRAQHTVTSEVACPAT